MTPKQRLETVIRGGLPDRVPATVHQWQPYHYRNVMGVADELEAFLAVGLDAVIYPWACVKPCASLDWRGASVETTLPDGMVAIETSLHTPDGVLTGKAMRSPYTTTTTEHLFKRPEDMRLIEKYQPVSELDVDAVCALKARLGDHGILRCYIMMPSDHFFHAPRASLEHYAAAVRDLGRYRKGNRP